MALFNQEDLNAVRQLVRAWRSLERMDPVIEKLLVAEEEIALLQRERAAIVAEIAQLKADNKAAHETHETELKSMIDKRENQTNQIAEQVQFQRDQEQIRLASWVKEETLTAQASIRTLTDQIAALDADLNRKRQESKDLDAEINSKADAITVKEQDSAKLQQQKALIQGEIDAMLNRIKGQ